jgi:uncharacterized membrane protein
MKKEAGHSLSKDHNGVLTNLVHPHTFGQKSADGIAKWAGSWTFILSFLILLGLWMAANVYAWINTWDPYPFILLNLVLSCIAALQAPVILMSQNRQAQKDRVKAEYDYRVNRKAEKYIEEILKRVKSIEGRKRKK